MSRKPQDPVATEEKAEHRTTDDLTIIEFDAIVDKSKLLFAQGFKMWPEMRGLSSAQRAQSKGRTAFQMGEIFTKLFTALRPSPPLTAEEEAKLTADEKQARTIKQRLLDLFHGALGAQDHGLKPDEFEVELLLRRLHRALRQQELAEELMNFARLMSDDALVAGEKVAGPGTKALKLAKSFAENNPSFGTLLFPALDLANKMTLSARKAQAEKRAQALAAKVAEAQKKKGQSPAGGGSSGEPT